MLISFKKDKLTEQYTFPFLPDVDGQKVRHDWKPSTLDRSSLDNRKLACRMQRRVDTTDSQGIICLRIGRPNWQIMLSFVSTLLCILRASFVLSIELLQWIYERRLINRLTPFFSYDAQHRLSFLVDWVCYCVVIHTAYTFNFTWAIGVVGHRVWGWC